MLKPSSNPSPLKLRRRPFPAITWIAAALLIGIVLGAWLPAAPPIFLTLAAVWLAMSWQMQRRSANQFSSGCLLLAGIWLGVCRWQVAQVPPARPALRQLADSRPVVLKLHARVDSVPQVHVKPESAYAPRLYGSAEQTRFRVRSIGLVTDTTELPVDGDCLVYVDGNATARLFPGQEIHITGKLDWPDTPGNPGEFDFAEFLERRQVAALLYVNHPFAIEPQSGPAYRRPGHWLNRLRTGAREILVNSVDQNVRGVALALLLGNRNEIPMETERAFVASGTMHLLAISGLHVGILCLFLLRLFNLLIVPRQRALLLTLLFCVIYMMVTDLRPSVVRATVFFGVFVLAEHIRRRQRMAGLISVTALIMLLWQPALAFDTGAWLSFLSVAALGWAGDRTANDHGPREAPADAITGREKLQAFATSAGTWLRFRYRQMFCILALTTPLIATAFHVVSPIGLAVNVLLIPATAVVLCLGFVTLATGLLLPSMAPLPGAAFSTALRFLTGTVDTTSSLPAGHLYVADLPVWFLPVYYGTFVTVLLLRPGIFRRTAAVALFGSVILAFVHCTADVRRDGIRCTILDVGHGSASVVELPGGRVLLVDAGAMNQGERTADLLCGFLWNRGYRRVDGLVISHADLDHYNAVPALLSRIPVAEIITSRQAAASDSRSLQALFELVAGRDIPVRLALDGAFLQTAGAEIRILQAHPGLLPANADDNQHSLVLSIEYAGRRILLPADIEGDGAKAILPRLSQTDVLVSPHHGSPNANNAAIASATKPRHVIVSARDADAAARLCATYGTAENVRFTSDCGAVTVQVSPDGRLQTTAFRGGDEKSSGNPAGNPVGSRLTW
ncbi:MAG: ComEC/Rec2 family competence protein [Fuerstiella sp.]